MSFLRVIGQFVSEFARLILFIASVIFLLSSTLLLLFSFESRKALAYVQLDGLSTFLAAGVALSAYLVVLAIIGVCASFFSSESAIRLLAIMTALNVVLGLVVLVSSSSKVDSAPIDLDVKLKHLQEKYDWEHRETKDLEVMNATKTWDSVQAELKCCGVEGPADWDRYKPKGHEKEHILPLSCCINYEKDKQSAKAPPAVYCDATKKEDIWSGGCKNEMRGSVELMMDLVVFVVSFSLVVGVLSAIVLCFRPSTVSVRSYPNGNYS